MHHYDQRPEVSRVILAPLYTESLNGSAKYMDQHAISMKTYNRCKSSDDEVYKDYIYPNVVTSNP